MQFGMRSSAVKKLWEEDKVDKKWKETNWSKTRERANKRKQLTDFDRFKLLRLKKQRRFEQQKALAKVKASA